MDLFKIPIIQIALAVIISWTLFAIFIGFIQEAFAQVLAERGRFMKAYMLKQLNDGANKINWATLLYKHGAVDLLTRESNKPTNDINSHLFAEVLIDVVGKAEIVQQNKQAGKYRSPSLANFKSAMLTLNDSDVISFLRLAFNNAELRTNNRAPEINEAAVYDQLVSQIEAWYKEFTERLTLWYKKRMRKKLFIIGVIVSLFINVDSVQLFNYYSINPQSRASVINYYNNYSYNKLNILNTD